MIGTFEPIQCPDAFDFPIQRLQDGWLHDFTVAHGRDGAVNLVVQQEPYQVFVFIVRVVDGNVYLEA